MSQPVREDAKRDDPAVRLVVRRSELVLSEKEKNPSVGIGKIVKLVQAKDPLFSRERIREIAHKMRVEGTRGRPRKNSAE